jgi:type IV pilus assembly protein PilA
MKSDLQVKFLSFMTGRKKGEGFTLIELLVVIIIIGILAAIALPSFLNQANKAKQSEAKQYVGAIVRAQQAYYLEEGTFTSTFDELAKVVKADTTNYEYTMTEAVVGGLDSVSALGKAKTTAKSLKSYIGGVQVATVASGTGADAKKESTTFGGLCESTEVGDAGAVVKIAISTADGKTTCTGGREVKK